MRFNLPFDKAIVHHCYDIFRQNLLKFIIKELLFYMKVIQDLCPEVVEFGLDLTQDLVF